MGKHFTLENRVKLEGLLQAGISKIEISKILGCHISTVYREIKKGLYQKIVDYKFLTMKSFYSYDKAHSIYISNSLKHVDIKINRDKKLKHDIEKLIKQKYSPCAIVAKLEKSKNNYNVFVCYKTIYNYVHNGHLKGINKHSLLYKTKNKKSKPMSLQPLKGFNLTRIDDRPFKPSERLFGHWEMDTVIGKKTKDDNCLLVLTERKTRYELIYKIQDKTINSVHSVLNSLERHYKHKFNKIFKSITCDNGSEFLSPKYIENSLYTKKKRTTIYYCYPYSSWQRGSNENNNKFIRRWIPKGQPIKPYTDNEIYKIQHYMNHYPRKIFDYDTSYNRFHTELKKLL